MTTDYTQHISALRTLAALSSVSTDLNMRSKAATLLWLADRFAELEKERDQLAEDLSPTKMEAAR